MSESDPPGGFAENIGQDLAEGRVLELAELYSADALSAGEEIAIDQFLEASPGPVRRDFFLRVEHTREALAAAYGTFVEDPPPELLIRILAKLAHPRG
ncbi:RskA family anti-sigma factor [Pseudarthrobacter albicanus]|uniref:RskA family anti-sigma factor n=1 Tax=Pseudarthrobacter albicanus TaxID=2823873 RepID=UPI001BAB716F|nr:hypothetical protein [Pseudarthrobacter albicanus]